MKKKITNCKYIDFDYNEHFILPHRKYKKRRTRKKYYGTYKMPKGIKLETRYSWYDEEECGVEIIYPCIPFDADWSIIVKLWNELQKTMNLRQEETVTICDETGYIKLSIGGKIMYKTTNLTLKVGNKVYAICYDDRLRQYVTIYQFSKEANNEYPACTYITKDKVSYFNDLGTEFAKNIFGEEKDMINVSIAHDKENKRLYAEIDRENNVLVDCYDNEIRHMYGLVHMFKGATVL